VRLLLPPSETKLKGGLPATGQLVLSFPRQDTARIQLMASLEQFCHDEPTKAAKALKLGPKSIDEIGNNVFEGAPVMPAIDRYTGVLYSATGVADWSDSNRQWAGEHVFIHSALFGAISSADEIPNYRLSYDSKVAGISLRDFWGGAVSAAIADMVDGDWVLDCRSEGYRALAPVPQGVESRYLEVVTRDGGKALNHFNKIHKGDLVRHLVESQPDTPSPESFADWAGTRGLRVSLEKNVMSLAV
jgi:uncharacterized protein